MTDRELMERVQQDELQFMEVLFNKYAPRLCHYFRKMTGDFQASEDLTQTVFEKVIRNRHTYKGLAPVSAWMFRIAKNSLMEHYRVSKRNRSVDIQGIDFSDEPAETPPEQEAEHKQRLHRALNRLKPEHREILILTRFENLEYKEVAKIIGISETGVKSRVFRAIKSLKKAYYQNTAINEKRR